MLKHVCILIFASAVGAQDFGTFLNKSSIIVNFINEDQARAYDSRISSL